MNTTQQGTKVISHIAKGLIIGLIVVVLQAVIQFGVFSAAAWIRFLPIIFLAIAIVWACIHYKKQMQYNVTFGNIFNYGFKATIIASLLMIVFVVAAYIIFPEMKENTIQEIRMQMGNDDKLSSQQIEQNIALIRRFFFPINIGKVLIVYAVVGLIASVLGAAVAKKNPRSI